MTSPSLTAPLSLESLDAAMDAVREGGLRMTSARRLVLEALFRARRPLRAEEIAEGIGGMPPSDIASVYRNLETLERLGIVRHVHLGHGPGLYALPGRDGQEFLVCESCDSVQALDAGELDDLRKGVRRRFGFEPRFSHFPLFGLCKECATR